VFAEEPALVGGVEDDGVVGEVGLVEGIEDVANAVVDGGDAAEIVLGVALVFPADEVGAVEFGGVEGGVLGVVGGLPLGELLVVELPGGRDEVEGAGVEVLRRWSSRWRSRRWSGR
jgi:hypothetical protein